jgi:hypothetical protein
MFIQFFTSSVGRDITVLGSGGRAASSGLTVFD